MKLLRNLFLIFLFVTCDNSTTERNPFIQEIGFRIDLDLNLPLFSPLTNVGSAIFVGTQGAGVNGVFVINTGFNTFRAFEATCPNVVFSPCSQMELDGQNGICPCNDNEFSLFTGQLLNPPEDGSRFFNLLEYRAQFSGNVVTISN